ncbi:MAG: hypothetical protein HXY38_06485 [Chloroflexi bacterium]|nr:hypothetical protein [Chloroflexota bacterium]
MKNFRDIERLSAYLDGQLDAAESASMESRLKSDPELESTLRNLRSARGILRQLPQRKAPRNFTLTRQMVGLKPPLPRSYPIFRLATIFASILFLFSLSATALSPLVSFENAAAPAPAFGMGGGCEDCEGAPAQEAGPATEEAFAAEMAPAATEEALMEEAAPLEATDEARIIETPSAKEPVPETEDQAEVIEEAGASSSFNWTILFLVIAVVSGLMMWVLQFTARKRWR